MHPIIVIIIIHQIITFNWGGGNFQFKYEKGNRFNSRIIVIVIIAQKGKKITYFIKCKI